MIYIQIGLTSATTDGTPSALSLKELVVLSWLKSVRVLDPSFMGRLGATLSLAGSANPAPRREEPDCPVLLAPSAQPGLR